MEFLEVWLMESQTSFWVKYCLFFWMNFQGYPWRNIRIFQIIIVVCDMFLDYWSSFRCNFSNTWRRKPKMKSLRCCWRYLWTKVWINPYIFHKNLLTYSTGKGIGRCWQNRKRVIRNYDWKISKITSRYWMNVERYSWKSPKFIGIVQKYSMCCNC